MKGFFQLRSADEFRALIEKFPPLGTETVELGDALGRVCAEDLSAPGDLPPFARSAMDGYALRAQDTFGASETEPCLLKISGEIPMGGPDHGPPLESGQAARIWTGGQLPAGANAVVMEEYTSRLNGPEVEVTRPAAPGENVIRKGEDVPSGAILVPAGVRLRPQELGLLAGLGLTRLPVHRRPLVGILSTGDELVLPDNAPGPGQIRDINGTTLAALVRTCGGDILSLGLVKDDPRQLHRTCGEALEAGADVLLVSGGSSVGRRDFTLGVFQNLPGAEILAHGISIRPGKPTILARAGKVALFGIPGHCASAMVVFDLFVRGLLAKISGISDPWTHGSMTFLARLARNVSSAIGREDYLRVRMCGRDETLPVVEPVFGKSGLISPMVRADGLIRVDRDTEGLDAGAMVEVRVFS